MTRATDLPGEVAILREELKARDGELARARQAPQTSQAKQRPQAAVAQPIRYTFEPVYERFKRQTPPQFEGTNDPMVAEDGLRTLEVVFEHMELDDRQRISCVAFQLKIDA